MSRSAPLQYLLALAYVIERNRQHALDPAVPEGTPIALDILRRLATREEDPTALLRPVVDRVLAITRADGVSLALVGQDGRATCVARAGSMAPLLGVVVEPGHGLSGECLKDGVEVNCPDTERDPRADPDVCRACGMRSLVAVPILGSEGVHGFIEAMSCRANAFGDKEVILLEAIGAALGTAAQPNGAGPTDAADAAPPEGAGAGQQASLDHSASLVLAPAQRRSWGVPIATAGAIVIMLAATYLAVQLRRPAPPPAQTNPAPTVSGGQALAAQSTLPPSAAPPASKVATLEAVRFVSRPDSTTVQLELSRKVEVRRGRLTHPERVYFDLLGTRMATSLSAVPDRGKLIEVADPQVSRIRVAEHAGGITRVVVDLKCRCEDLFVQFPEPPYRLVIDIRAAPRHQVRAVGAPIGILAPAPSKENSTVRAAAHRIRIVLDPGHGGEDLGTLSPDGIREKDVVLDIARRLGPMLTARLDAEVVFTRTDDRAVSLAARAALANAAAADLMISIHGNSSPDRSARGVETYYFAPGSGETQLRGRATASRRLAASVQRALALRPGDASEAGNRGIKTAAFTLLTDLDMPAVLTEVAFLSSPIDRRRLASAEVRNLIAAAICRGVASYWRSERSLTAAASVPVVGHIEKPSAATKP